MKVKKMIGVLIMVSLIITTVACSNNSSINEKKEVQAEKEFITVVTGNSGGAFFALGGVLAQIYGTLPDIIANAQATDGSGVNISLVNDGKAQIGFSNTAQAYYAVTGTEMYSEKKHENFMSLAELYPMYFQLVVRNDSGINSISDIIGKKIAVAPQNSGTEANVRQFLEVGWSITYDDFDESFISFSNAADQLKNNALDGAFIGSGIPNSSTLDLLSTGKYYLVSFDKEGVSKVVDKYPFFKYGIIPANTYSQITTDLGSITVGTTLIINKNVSEETAYKLTKALYENLDKLGEAHSSGKDIKLENATAGMSIKIHPGAKKYYIEKGIEIPENVQ
ncbi:MAG: TAXI family TRAP transporter solute-binding subunit [Tissierellales bacterium]|nr:TAXI family TRAP transporter solute-binding subunit [Tissierellales bacterium]